MINEAEYVLPFDINAYPIRVSQGRNGSWSHFLHTRRPAARPDVCLETDLTHAVDFALPLGTEVRAAREGLITDYWLGSNWYYEGLDPKIGNNPPLGSTNFLIIQHKDGTIAWYSHLGRNMPVRRGQPVRAGEVIAVTGQSGWIAQIPHLHFQVNTPGKLLTSQRSISVTFRNYDRNLDHETLLREGHIWFGDL